jgi:hypothetical protein
VGDADRDGCPDAPDTSVTSGPADGAIVLSRSTTFGFASSERDASFTCAVDGQAGPCGSSQQVGNLGSGTHRLRVAAHDAAGDVDPTPVARTWTVPHDDRQLLHSGGWKQQAVPGHFDGTVSKSRQRGSALTATVADATRIALVAARGPHNGRVRVLLGGTLLKTVGLTARTSRPRQLIPVATFSSPASGTVRVVVATAGKVVRIDALAVVSR